jgi:hypothetical protein
MTFYNIFEIELKFSATLPSSSWCMITALCTSLVYDSLWAWLVGLWTLWALCIYIRQLMQMCRCSKARYGHNHELLVSSTLTILVWVTGLFLPVTFSQSDRWIFLTVEITAVDLLGVPPMCSSPIVFLVFSTHCRCDSAALCPWPPCTLKSSLMSQPRVSSGKPVPNSCRYSQRSVLLGNHASFLGASPMHVHGMFIAHSITVFFLSSVLFVVALSAMLM